MRQKIRRGIGYLALLMFPITLNYFSPYLSVSAAIDGIVAGSVITFFVMFLTGLVFGRGWCGWVCPMSGLSEITNSLNDKSVNRKRLSIVRYTIFGIWFTTIIIFFVLKGGIQGINPLFMSESVVSVDMPLKYITYYMVLAVFIIPNLIIGKRASCHTLCWMSPFLEAGYMLGSALRLWRLRIISKKENCIQCSRCNKVCPMSIKVMETVPEGFIKTKDCILCGQCVDICPKGVLSYKFKR